MSFTRRVLLAAAVGCGLTMTEVRADDDVKLLIPDDAPIKAIVAHFAKNGIKLQRDERDWWVVVDPKADGYEVVLHLRTFPVGTTEKEMRDFLRRINLAYMLNAPARVAMSYPGARVTDPEKKPPKREDLPVAVKLERLFKEYRPSEPRK
jgi:hypothetical protein